ncbi:hypothetical protein ES703_55768 [subsurface metagenome]
MGHIRRLDSNADIQAFPGANFEIAGSVPAPQCSEAKIEGIGELKATNQLWDTAKFTGWDLSGKFVTVVSSTPDRAGTYPIASNGDDFLWLGTEPGNAVDVVYYVHNGGALILTRNVSSFAAFIHAAGYAYTIKGGKLYTNIPAGQLKNACTILFDPLT